MDKSKLSAEDFVLDTHFRDWVLHPNKKRNLIWQAYLDENPQHAKEIYLAREIILNLPTTTYTIDEEEISLLWDKIDLNLSTEHNLSQERPSVPIHSKATINKYMSSNPQKLFNYPLLKIVAMLALTAFLGFLYYSLPERPTHQPIKWLTYSTNPGVKSTLTLSDGTKVTLNAGTSIKYVQNFAGDSRQIFLEGEAFFEVAHDSIKPFIVHTEDIVTRALGTSFNIKANKAEKIAISLVTGKVEVKSQEVLEFQDYLTPGEQVNTFGQGSSWEKDSFDEESVTAWMYQTIIFDETPLPEAIKILENWFGVTITINHFNDQNLTLSGKYKNETLANILEGLSYTARFTYKINGNKIQINFTQ